MSPIDSAAIRLAWNDAASLNGFTAPARYLGPAIAEPGAWVAAGGAASQNVETSPWFHTTGDVEETLSAEAIQ